MSDRFLSSICTREDPPGAMTIVKTFARGRRDRSRPFSSRSSAQTGRQPARQIPVEQAAPRRRRRRQAPSTASRRAVGLRCGTSRCARGIRAGQDAKGNWSGFDIDFCRAVAAAMLRRSRQGRVRAGVDPPAVRGARERVDRRARPHDDMDPVARDRRTISCSRGSPITTGRGSWCGATSRSPSAANLSSDQICVAQDTTTELNLADYFRQRGLRYAVEEPARRRGRARPMPRAQCGAVTTDASALFVLRSKLPHPEDNIILPEIISKEPLGPVVRQGDDRWFEIVRWTLTAMIDAEEMGVDQANVDAVIRGRQSAHPPSPRRRGQFRPGPRPHRRLGLSDHQVRRQLRRRLRAQPRQRLAAEDQARPQRPVDARRPALRPADPVMPTKVVPLVDFSPSLNCQQRPLVSVSRLSTGAF